MWNIFSCAVSLSFIYSSNHPSTYATDAFELVEFSGSLQFRQALYETLNVIDQHQIECQHFCKFPPIFQPALHSLLQELILIIFCSHLPFSCWFCVPCFSTVCIIPSVLVLTHINCRGGKVHSWVGYYPLALGNLIPTFPLGTKIRLIVWLPPKTDIETRIQGQVVYQVEDPRTDHQSNKEGKVANRRHIINELHSGQLKLNPVGDLWQLVQDKHPSSSLLRGEGAGIITHHCPQLLLEGCFWGVELIHSPGVTGWKKQPLAVKTLRQNN